MHIVLWQIVFQGSSHNDCLVDYRRVLSLTLFAFAVQVGSAEDLVSRRRFHGHLDSVISALLPGYKTLICLIFNTTTDFTEAAVAAVAVAKKNEMKRKYNLVAQF